METEARPTILIVEDDKPTLRLVRKVLERAGFATSSVATGREAVRKACNGTGMVLLLDYRLPDMTGRDVVEKIREQGAEIPFVVMTGQGDERVAVEMMKLGARDYVIKDRGFADLLPRVIGWVMEQIDTEAHLRRAVEDLRDSEGRLKSIFENVSDGILLLDMEGRILRLNAAAARMAAIDAEEWIGRNFKDIDFLSDESLLAVLQMFASIEAGAAPQPLEIQIHRPDGTVRYGETSPTLLVGESGVEGILVVIRDVTEWKLTQATLTQSEARYRFLAENTNDMLYAADTEGILTYVGPQISRYGYTQDDAVGKRLIDLVHEEDRQRVIADFIYSLSTGKEFPTTFRIRDRRGNIHWLEDLGKIHRNDLDEVTGIAGVLRDVTERKEAEEAQRKSEAKLRAILDASPTTILVVDLGGKIIDCNQSALAMHGYSRKGELLGRSALKVVLAPGDRERGIAAMKKMARGQSTTAGEYTVMSSDGREFPVEVSAGPIMGDTGQPVAFVMVYHDITERKLIEHTLRENAARQRALLEVIPDVIFRVSRAGEVLDYSVTTESDLYVPEDRIIGWQIAELFPPEAARITLENVEMALASGTMQSFEYQMDLTCGIRTYEARMVPSGSDEVVALSRDITERKKAEEQLRMSEQTLKRMFESVSDGITVLDMNGVVVEANDRAAELHGYGSKREYTGQSFRDLMTSNEIDRAMKNTRNTLRTLSGHVEEYALRKADGTVFPAEVNVNVLLDQSGDPIGLIWLTRDITDRKRAQEEVQRSHDSLSVINTILQLSLEDADLPLLLDRVLDLVLSVSWVELEPHGAVFLADPESQTLVLTSHSGLADQVKESCGRIAFGQCLCGQAAATQEILFADRVDERHTTRYEPMEDHAHYCVPIASGGCLWGVMNLYAKAGHALDDHEMQFLTSVANALAGVIERKRAENELVEKNAQLKHAMEQLKNSQEQLLQSEKLAAVGQLVSGVAHELNNPLMAISSTVELMQRYIKDEIAIEDLNSLQSDTDRAISIVRNLLSFARKQEPRKQQVSVNEVLESVIDLRTYELRLENIQVVKDFQADLPATMADYQQLQQVFLNLIINAEQAMAAAHGKGTLRIETKQVGDMVRVVFADDGPGIPSQMMSRIFEPFFTTRPVGQGTGLGLSICYGIIQEHAGEICVASTEGTGTEFTVDLPMVHHGALSGVGE